MRAKQLIADRDAAILWARDLLAHPETWVLLDTETTSIDGEPISVAVVAPDGTTLFESLIKPEWEEITQDASAVHGITAAEVAGAPLFPEVWAKLKRFMADKTIVAYNAQFDNGILYTAIRRHDLKLVGCKWQCAMEEYAAFVGEVRWDRWERCETYRWQPLPGGDHTAAGDCRATLALIKRMAEAKLSMEQEEVSHA